MKSVFSFSNKDNILKDNDFGMANGILTVGADYHDVFALSGLWAPPYACPDFFMGIRLFGEKVATGEYEWLPWQTTRSGELNGISVSSGCTLAGDSRAVIIKLSFENGNDGFTAVPFQVCFKGSIDYVHVWDFPRAEGRGPKGTDIIITDKSITRINNNRVIILGTDLEGMSWKGYSSCWEGEVRLNSGEKRTCYLVCTVGEKNTSCDLLNSILDNCEKGLGNAEAYGKRKEEELFAGLPAFEASDKRLESYYYRSLVHYLTNKWEVPEFVLNPCYTTGSIKGGCLAGYLWDYAEGWKLHPLLDPAATREHIGQFLKIDISNCYSFNPMAGNPMGPWYPVNQEKIIGLIYYYVLHTGDAGFLKSDAGGKSVLDRVMDQALLGEDASQPVSLKDYGTDGENHLELRRGYPYCGIMPDLNGRRCLNYLWAYELSKLAGNPQDHLLERAEALKRLLKEKLWSGKDGWFCFIKAGVPDIRYTVQMFKLINNPVLDDEELEGLLGHLNDEEFLSKYGIHSISKKDPAYDQIDIDNGGGGIYTAFAPQIAERLYQAGFYGHAWDLLKRVLWWGEKTPYWGDSFVANYMDYRSDTPLQCNVGGVAGAQAIIFGMFGVEVLRDGSISINPHPPEASPEIALKNLRLRGKCLDIHVSNDEYRVDADGSSIAGTIGKPVIIR